LSRRGTDCSCAARAARAGQRGQHAAPDEHSGGGGGGGGGQVVPPGSSDGGFGNSLFQSAGPALAAAADVGVAATAMATSKRQRCVVGCMASRVTLGSGSGGVAWRAWARQ